jgi:hypothetical protein
MHYWCDCQHSIHILCLLWLEVDLIGCAEVTAVLVPLMTATPSTARSLTAMARRRDCAALFRFLFFLQFLLDFSALAGCLIVMLDESLDLAILALDLSYNLDVVFVVVVESDWTGDVVDVDDRIIHWLEVVDNVDSWCWCWRYVSSLVC